MIAEYDRIEAPAAMQFKSCTFGVLLGVGQMKELFLQINFVSLNNFKLYQDYKFERYKNVI
jgi:hypothetical protein